MTKFAIGALISAMLAVAPCASAQDPSTATLSDLDFMAGCWRGDFANGAALEEFYTQPSDNLILGLSRFMRGNRAVQHEFSRITADSLGITLLPFPGGKPSEHGFRLTSIDSGRALFEAPEHDFPKRIRYSKGADGSLAARIDGGEGDSRVQEWRMRPVSCRPEGRDSGQDASLPISPPDELASAVDRARATLRTLAARGMGISVAMIGKSGTMWSEAFGYADLPTRRPAIPETQFRVYSLAKPMTAVAAARLMEGGRLEPAAPVQRYVPAFPEKGAPITSMQLASHTSGIRHYAGDAEARSQRHCESLEDAIAIFSGDSLVHPPGERETYSSWGYVLLSAVVQKVAGRPFHEAMANLIFEPAGMSATMLERPGQDAGDRTSFYREAGNGGTKPEDTVDNSCKWGAGGFVSTAMDVARFGRAMIDGRLISDQTLQLFLDGESAYMAQGVGAGGTSFLIADAEHGAAIALLGNASGETIGPALRQAALDLHRAVTAQAKPR